MSMHSLRMTSSSKCSYLSQHRCSSLSQKESTILETEDDEFQCVQPLALSCMACINFFDIVINA